jgi:hypothetical protein
MRSSALAVSPPGSATSGGGSSRKRAFQIGALHLRHVCLGADQHAVAQVRVGQVRPIQVGAFQIGAGEARAAQIGARQARADQHRVGEVRRLCATAPVILVCDRFAP